MAKTEPKPVRFIERQETEPQGADGVRHRLYRIVETTNPPEGAETTDRDLCDWTEEK